MSSCDQRWGLHRGTEAKPETTNPTKDLLIQEHLLVRWSAEDELHHLNKIHKYFEALQRIKAEMFYGFWDLLEPGKCILADEGFPRKGIFFFSSGRWVIIKKLKKPRMCWECIEGIYQEYCTYTEANITHIHHSDSFTTKHSSSISEPFMFSINSTHSQNWN